ncbi:hypothetical protein QAD02_023328 [Eretmocerus hayati]|uniref:Uncharacterized protein n=1 Tax=Eretmocerus hayati TaxID=131215 RepID=A0ACC2PVA5_9HYME|nr:hypothetical protein QAD02_023328 [Eretmocerus hayati]
MRASGCLPPMSMQTAAMRWLVAPADAIFITASDGRSGRIHGCCRSPSVSNWCRPLRALWTVDTVGGDCNMATACPHVLELVDGPRVFFWSLNLCLSVVARSWVGLPSGNLADSLVNFKLQQLAYIGG